MVKHKATTGQGNTSTSGGKAGAEATYYSKLAAKLASKKRYPNASRRRHEEGVVTISFYAHPNGDASQLKIVESSGARRLDQAALDMVRQAQPLPAFELEMGAEPLSITLPVSFQLR